MDSCDTGRAAIELFEIYKKLKLPTYLKGTRRPSGGGTSGMIFWKGLKILRSLNWPMMLYTVNVEVYKKKGLMPRIQLCLGSQANDLAGNRTFHNDDAGWPISTRYTISTIYFTVTEVMRDPTEMPSSFYSQLPTRKNGCWAQQVRCRISLVDACNWRLINSMHFELRCQYRENAVLT